MQPNPTSPTVSPVEPSVARVHRPARFRAVGARDTDVAAFRVRCQERPEPCALRGQLGALGLRQPDDRFDREVGGATRPLELPSSAHVAVHQERAEVPEDVGVEQATAFVADHPRAVLVAQQRVVVLRQEAHGGRRVGRRTGRVRQVEQLASGLVAEDAQATAQALDHLTELRQAAPGLDVHDGGRAVPGQVPHHQVVQVRVRVERSSQPCLRGGPGRLPALAPHASRGDLDHRQQVSDGGHRVAVGIRPSLGEQRAKFGTGARPFLDEFADHLHERLGVDVLDRPAERASGPEHPRDDGLHQRTEPAHVARADQVDRRTHQRRSDRLPLRDQVPQRVRLEVPQPTPEPDVGVDRHLCLHPDQPLDPVGDRQIRSLEEHLACERRPVQRPRAEHVVRHEATS